MSNLYLALTHYPVVNKRGDVIASAVTNLDLHDISRAAKTYGLNSVYVVTPLMDQKILVERIVAHWTTGAGAAHNPARRRALELIKINASIEAVVDEIEAVEKRRPKTVATCARRYPSSIGYKRFRALLNNDAPLILVFGTAWGLAETFITNADYVLEPITGTAEYNHLSVRSAAAIILDRLLGTRT